MFVILKQTKWVSFTTLIILFGLKLCFFNYHVYRDEILLAEGKTVHVFVNTEGGLANVRRYAIWTRLKEIKEKCYK